MPELGTYPGPHVPQPFEVRCVGPEARIAAAQDVLNLTRMNWNTADIRGKWPVSLLFARRVGGILDECGDDDLVETSFRYFCVATGRRSQQRRRNFGGRNHTLRYTAAAAKQTHEREIACSSKLRTAAVQHLVQHH